MKTKILPFLFSLGFINFGNTQNLNLNISSTNNSCDSYASGTIQILPTNGTGPFSITWSDGGSGFVRNNLVSGSYTFTIQDATGLTANQTISIIGPVQINITHSQTNVTNGSQNNGSITITNPTNIQSADIEWSSNTNSPLVQGSSSQTNLKPGMYTIRLQDIYKCVHKKDVILPSLISNGGGISNSIVNPSPNSPNQIDAEINSSSIPDFIEIIENYSGDYDLITVIGKNSEVIIQTSDIKQLGKIDFSKTDKIFLSEKGRVVHSIE